jgi:hypothetical protein
VVNGFSLANGNLRAATADVEQGKAAFGRPDISQDPLGDQAGFFNAGNHPHINPGTGANQIYEFIGIGGFPEGAGAECHDSRGMEVLSSLLEAPEGMNGPPDRVSIEFSLKKDALAQADHQFFAMKLFDAVARSHLVHIETDRIRAEIDDSKSHRNSDQ